MKRRTEDITGLRFGRLIVLGSTFTRNKQYDELWNCRCECGNTVIVSGGKLKGGRTQSCGCLQRERTSKTHLKHGLCFNPGTKKYKRLYKIWISMKGRCFNPNDSAFKDYGGRGIGICIEWESDFALFHDWAIKSGYKDDLTIERNDVNGHYAPSNCKWIPKSDQAKNRRCNKILTLNGTSMGTYEWSLTTGIPRYLIRQRLRRGWNHEKTLTTKF